MLALMLSDGHFLRFARRCENSYDSNQALHKSNVIGATFAWVEPHEFRLERYSPAVEARRVRQHGPDGARPGPGDVYCEPAVGGSRAGAGYQSVHP
ncbi:hypothetical protein D3C76_1377210 [compost metagenome]